MLDERSASWKLLLPDGPRDRVLAVGLDAGGVVGLARTWRDVVWVPPSPEAVRDLEAADDDTAPYLANVRITNDLSGNGVQYDAVVVARPPRAMQRGASNLAGLCSDRGVLVSLGFAGSALTPSRLRRAGLRHVQCHAVLPADRPRVFFPTASRALRSRALAFHAPATRPRQWLLRASAALSDIGVRGHLHHGAVLVAGRASQSHNDVALAKWLSQALDLPVSGLVVYAGSESSRRKMTVLAVADGDRHDVVAKLADSTADRMVTPPPFREIRPTA